MKAPFKKSATYLLLISLIAFLSSCTVVGGIFKAGMWVGILMVVVVIGIILFVIAKVSGGSSGSSR